MAGKGKSSSGGSTKGGKSSSRSAPSRKAPAQGAAKGRPRSSGASRPKRPALKKKAKATKGLPLWLSAGLRQTAKWTTVVGLGLCLGGSFVSWTLYRQAVRDVDAQLKGRVWASSGQVVSAPLHLWVGLRLSPVELAEDLQAAGYGRVVEARAPGDFQVAGDAVVVIGKGAGKDDLSGEVLVTFRGDRITSLSPTAEVHFAPAELAGMRGAENEARRPVALADLPAYVPRAVLAMEDSRFYEHEGLDPVGIARAVLVNAWRGGTMQGGSTLTQQLVKNLFLTQERTVERKAREAILAVALESQRSKDEILELYLNEIYLGQVGGVAICGIDQAARAYFGKPAERLELGEAATLAGIVSAPNRYSPLRHPEAARERRDLTLSRMADVAWLDPIEAEVQKRKELELHPTGTSRRAPWAVDAAVDLVESEQGEGSIAARGLTVQTTIQPALQRLAERAVAEGLAELEQTWPTTAGAQMSMAVVRVKDGAVLALVGSSSYADSQFDRASHGARQLGSTIKPLTALVAMEADPTLSPASVFEDAPIERVVDGKTWAPRNYDGGFRGEMTIREALRVSRNIPAVLLAEHVGMRPLRAGWEALGLSEASANPAAALGSFSVTPLELAAAYTAIPGGGRVARPLLVSQARTASGEHVFDGVVDRSRVASPETAWLVSSMLEDVMTSGTGKRASVYGATGALGGKTGTTDAARDAWFVGYSSELVVAVWVGFDRDKVLGLTGGQAALPTWARFMSWSGTASSAFPRPKGLHWEDGCVACATDGTCLDSDGEWFRNGSQPQACGGGGLFGLQPGDENLWDAIQERLEARKSTREERREERRARQLERGDG